MIRRIELVNFMSHAHTVIEPAAGLTVLVGPNNCGKSAVVAALQILAHNETSTYVMRHGEKECSVTIETDDGRTVQWRRRKSPAYFVDGKELSRLERSEVPEEVGRVLRLSMIEPEGGQPFDIHFGEQKSPVFLLDKPGSQAAQFFASSSDASKLVEMQKRHQQKMSDARRERTRLDADAERLARDLSVLAEADPLGLRLQAIEELYSTIGQSSAEIVTLMQGIRVLSEAAERWQRLESEAAALNQVQPPPTLQVTGPLAEVIGQLTQAGLTGERHTDTAAALIALRAPPLLAEELPLSHFIQAFVTARRVASRLAAECEAAGPLVAPPALAEFVHLSSLTHSLAAASQRLISVEGTASTLAGLAVPPSPASESELAADVAGIRRAVELLDKVSHLSQRLDAVRVPPTCDDTNPLQQLVATLFGHLAAAQSSDDAVAAALAELTGADTELRRWGEIHPHCPTCGSAIDLARLAEHARMHGGLHA